MRAFVSHLRAGFTRPINISNCAPLIVTTNACVGQCFSYAVPNLNRVAHGVQHEQMKEHRVVLKRFQPQHEQWIASTSSCCTVLAAVDVLVAGQCLGGPQTFVFKSATQCGCGHCAVKN